MFCRNYQNFTVEKNTAAKKCRKTPKIKILRRQKSANNLELYLKQKKF